MPGGSENGNQEKGRIIPFKGELEKSKVPRELSPLKRAEWMATFTPMKDQRDRHRPKKKFPLQRSLELMRNEKLMLQQQLARAEYFRTQDLTVWLNVIAYLCEKEPSLAQDARLQEKVQSAAQQESRQVRLQRQDKINLYAVSFFEAVMADIERLFPGVLSQE